MSDDHNVPRWIPAAAGVLLIALGVAGVVLIAYAEIVTTRFLRVEAPGATDLRFEKPGRYTVLHEYRTVREGGPYRSPGSLPPLRFEVIDPSTSASVVLMPGVDLAEPSRWKMRARYSFGERAGVSVLTFSLAHPGTYRIATSYPSDDQEPVVMLSITRNLTARTVWTVLISLAVLTAAIVPASYLMRKGWRRIGQ